MGTWGEGEQVWAVGAIWSAGYGRGEWMTREETNQSFSLVEKGPIATQSRGQAVHIPRRAVVSNFH